MPVLSDILGNTLATNKILLDIHSSALGWQAKIHDVHVASGPKTFLYVWDQPTNWVWMASVAREAFVDLSSKVLGMSPAEIDDIRGSVFYYINLAASKKKIDNPDDLDWEEQLGLSLTLYAGTTQTWKQAERMQDGGHFVVLNYRDDNASEGKLRPFAISNTMNNPLSAAELMESIRHVAQSNKARHPEWFT